MILCELLYKLVLFCDIVRVGKNSYCEFDKFEFTEVKMIAHCMKKVKWEKIKLIGDMKVLKTKDLRRS